MNQGLETRGRTPTPYSRSAVCKYIHIELDRMLRTEFSIHVLYGNKWPGYFENGNPTGPPRPGPIPEPVELIGIRDTKFNPYIRRR